MTIEIFVRRYNQVVLVLALLFVVDMALPYTVHEGSVIGTHRPVTTAGHGEKRLRTDEVIIETSGGTIKVRPDHLGKITKGDAMRLYKTFIFGISKKIFLPLPGREFPTVNLLFSWFGFLPFVVIFLSVVVMRTKNKETLLNFGFSNIVLSGFSLILLLKDYIE